MSTALVPSEIIENKIFIIRGQKVMLSVHLAKLYEVQVRTLVQAVKRNAERFPKDFMFQLNHQEYENLKSQIVISSWGGARRAKPYAFTQEGIAMLSSVLNSPRAVQVNIQIMRAFVKLRELMISHKDLARKIEQLEEKFNKHDENFVIVFKVIIDLLSTKQNVKSPDAIGSSGWRFNISRTFAVTRRANLEPSPAFLILEMAGRVLVSERATAKVLISKEKVNKKLLESPRESKKKKLPIGFHVR